MGRGQTMWTDCAGFVSLTEWTHTATADKNHKSKIIIYVFGA